MDRLVRWILYRNENKINRKAKEIEKTFEFESLIDKAIENVEVIKNFEQDKFSNYL